MKTKLLSFLLFLFPMVAFAEAVEVEIDGINYELISMPKGNMAKVVQSYKYQTYDKIEIPNSVIYNEVEYIVTSIGDDAFYYCPSLISVTIPNNVKTIGSGAFCRCTGLTSIKIGNNVSQIGGSAFYGCNSLTTVYVSDLTSWCQIAFGDNYANPLVIAPHLFLNGEEIKDMIIPDGVNSISEFAFFCYVGLNSVIIPNSVINIGRASFWRCIGLTSIDISNSVISIGEDAFYYCSELKSVTIPNSISSIERGVFLGCKKLYSVIIPSSVTTIGTQAFSGCSSLTDITIPNSVTELGSFAFEGCSSLTSVNIPNSVTSIPRGIFSSCSSLSKIVIPNKVTSIESSAFSNCSNLTTVSVPKSINDIKDCAFQTCPQLSDFYCYAENVPQTGIDVFKNSHIEFATLHVPENSVEIYKSATPWKDFKSIVAIVGETPKCATPTISYNDGKLSFDSETEGAEYVYEITDADVKKGYTAEVQLTATYNISVYATKTGYDNSEVVTATLCWIDQNPQTEGITNDIANIAVQAVLIQFEGGMLNVQNLDDGTQVSLYSVEGQLAGTVTSHNGVASLGTTLQPGTPAIVRVGNKSVKVVVR